MVRWADLKVKGKLLVFVVGGCLALAAVGGMGLANMKRISAGLGEVNANMGHVATLQEMKNDFLQLRLDLVYMMALADRPKIDEKAADMDLRTRKIRKTMDAFENEGLDARERELLQVFKGGFEAYLVQGNRLAEMAKSAASGGGEARSAVVRFATDAVAPLYNRPAEAVAGLVAYDLKGGAALYQEEMGHYRSSVRITAGVVLAVLAAALLAGVAIANSISRPLARVLDALGGVASGDLTARLACDTRDEMGLLARNVNAMGERLQEIIAQVAQNAVQVASAANQLYSTSELMATGAEEVAAQTGTVATASEEMAATSAEIAHNCTMAAGGARQANDLAITGSAVVSETVMMMNRIAEQVKESAQAMDGLGEKSDQIGAIVSTIEDIADQTNLLALNAAIEAARAGEQGRGFAVVADEVRALAERTTNATREIGAMIKAIQGETREAVSAMEEGVKEVEKGTSEATRSCDALSDILSQIDAVATQVQQIATAAEQQTATTDEISNNIQQITQVVQETSNGAHESAHAASQLSGLAGDLQRLVGQFKLAA